MKLLIIKLFIIFSILFTNFTSAEIKIVSPSSKYYFVSGGNNSVIWTFDKTIDPKVFSAYLNNPDIASLKDFAILSATDIALGTADVSIPSSLINTGFVIKFTNIYNISDIYATSEPFEIKPAGSTPITYVPPVPTASPSSTSASKSSLESLFSNRFLIISAIKDITEICDDNKDCNNSSDNDSSSGRDYPLGYNYFKPKLKSAFIKKSELTDPSKIQEAINHGEYVLKEIRYPQELENKYRVTAKVLGTGSFAVVKECVEKKTNESYALKILTKKVLKGKEKILSTELDILKKVHHPYVVSLHDLYESKEGVFIVTDLASGGELFSQLLLKGSYTEKDAADLARKLLEGVAYLHDLGIVHRDLKPENLLFKDTSEDADILITDFGLSKILTSTEDVLFTACGTPDYVAPEVLLQVGHNKPVDVWSIGVILYVMLCGYTPFWGENQAELFESIMSGEYDFEEEYWSEISDSAMDLIEKMLTHDPSKRITAKEACKHPWFESAKKVDILEKVKSNFSAKERFKKAVHIVRGVNRLRKSASSTTIDNVNNSHELVDKKENISTISIELQQEENKHVEEGSEVEKEQKDDDGNNINNDEIKKENIVENAPKVQKITP
ncbi:23815_t:CDS:10 [Entrophospora sp. SA101]|nr:23815_t:CDS:10 [Entrophospora sp. SA101]